MNDMPNNYDTTDRKMVYDGGEYWIEMESNGTAWFCDENACCELTKIPRDPSYIKYDEHRGWIYKNGRDLPWAPGC